MPPKESGPSTLSSVPAWIAYEGKVLLFNCFFKEPVYDSPIENFRVRECELLYYLEDDSIQVNEVRESNSGIQQGELIRRHQIPKSASEFFQLGDLKLSSSITLYGKEFYIYNCDKATEVGT